jgi:hypothetical protein
MRNGENEAARYAAKNKSPSRDFLRERLWKNQQKAETMRRLADIS